MVRPEWESIKTHVSPNLYNVLVDGIGAEQAIKKTKFGDVLPSNAILSGAGVELVTANKREFVLKYALEGIKKEYDYIFIDCPPSLEMLTLNALCAADTVLIPGPVRVFCTGRAERFDFNDPDDKKSAESGARD